MSEHKSMKKSILWLLLGICIIMALLVLSITLGWWNRVERIAGMWVWWALSLVLVAGVSVIVVGGIAVLREFIPRYREKRFLARLRSNNGDTPVDEEEESYRQLRDKMRDAIQTLEKSPELRRKKGLSLYTVPWYLLIGASQSGKTTLLRSVANSFAPFAHPSSSTDTLTKNCDWWFFNTAIVLDTAGHYAFPVKGERDSTHWYRFLELLRSHRDLQPINGLIITVAADTLITKRQEDLLLEFLRKARLRKERVGTSFQCALLDGPQGVTRENENGNAPGARIAFQAANHGDPVDPRHCEVHHDELQRKL